MNGIPDNNKAPTGSMKHVIAFTGLLVVATTSAQNNPIFQGGNGDGYVRSGISQPVSTFGIFAGGFGDGYVRGGVAQAVSTPGIFSGGAADGYARTGFAQPISTAGIFSGGLGDGYARNSGTSVKIAIQGLAMLEGPYNTSTLLMNDNLRAAGLVPLTEPFTALGYPNASGSGGETTTGGMLAITGPAAVVDWVRVELRDAVVPASLIAVRHALVIRTGSILDPVTGDDFIRFDAFPGNYHIVVRHRNHLGVMTASPIALSATATEIDFSSSATSTFGTAAQKAIGAVNLLWAGDVNGDHQLKYTGSGNDRDPILVALGSTNPNNILSAQYDRRDVNLDGVIKYIGSANDRDPILIDVGSTTPNNTRTEQVP